MLSVSGGEGIIIHNNCIILGVQKENRWYNLDNNKYGAIVKTIGGKLEKIDHGSMKKALIREIKEELNLSLNNIKVSHKYLFEKEIFMKDYNPFDKESKLKMTAKFYHVDVLDNIPIISSDLPFILEIPIKDFINLEYNVIIDSDILKKYFIKINKNLDIPKYLSLFIPEEVRIYLRSFYE